jgi:hypothetical protein
MLPGRSVRMFFVPQTQNQTPKEMASNNSLMHATGGSDDGLECVNEGCTKQGLYRCARCKGAKYCSAACQMVH